MTAFEVHRYQTLSGRIPFEEWLLQLNDTTVRVRLTRRIDRLADGLLGNWKSIGSGIFELKIDYGPGYRVYYGQQGTKLILLLCGGDKRTQTKDIERAHAYWQDYKARTRE